MTWTKVGKRAKVTSGTNEVFNNDGIRPTQWVSETQWSATLFRLPVTRAKGDKQKGSNKKRGRETVLFLLRLTGEVARRGRSDGIRTHGLLVPNQARYQLRYTSILSFLRNNCFFFDIAVDSTQARFRPASNALVDTLQTAHCADLLHASSQLRYTKTFATTQR